MLNMLLANLFTMLSFITFSSSIQYQSIDHTFTSIPIEYFEIASVVEEGDIHFNKELLEEKVNQYIHYSINKSIKNYDLAFGYYQGDNHDYCVNKECDEVEISLYAELIYKIPYKRVMRYRIRGNYG